MAKKSKCSKVNANNRPKNCDRAIVIQKIQRRKDASTMVPKQKRSGSSSPRKRKSSGSSTTGRPKRAKRSPKRLISNM